LSHSEGPRETLGPSYIGSDQNSAAAFPYDESNAALTAPAQDQESPFLL
jgi:hypothetical protein